MTKEQLLALRANPNVQTMLNLIAATEGTVKNGYATQFGGGLLASLDDHPRELHPFGDKGEKTSAAGRYQIIQKTFDENAKQLRLTDFGPVSQDLVGINLFAKAGALEDVLKGDFNAAIGKLGPTWASFPSSPYDQPKKSQGFVDRTLAALTGQPLPSAATVTAAKAPAANVISSLMSAARVAALPQVAAPAPAAAPMAWQDKVIEAQQQTPAWWQQEQMQQLADDDMEGLRQNAVSSFFGEQPMPRIAIPPEIDVLINRYLSMT